MKDSYHAYFEMFKEQKLTTVAKEGNIYVITKGNEPKAIPKETRYKPWVLDENQKRKKIKNFYWFKCAECK